MTVEQIRKAVANSLIEGDGWPPSLPEFIKSGQHHGFDIDESFRKMINREPLNDVEWWTVNEVGFKCRTQLPEDKARQVFKKAMEKYIKRKEEGKLAPRGTVMISNQAAPDWTAPDGTKWKSPAEYYHSRMK